MTKSHGSKADLRHLKSGAPESFYLHLIPPMSKRLSSAYHLCEDEHPNRDATSSCETLQALVILFPRRRNYQSLQGHASCTGSWGYNVASFGPARLLIVSRQRRVERGPRFSRLMTQAKQAKG